MPTPYDSYLKPVVSAWTERIKKAIEAKAPWQNVADQCMAFYSAKNGFLFEKEFRTKYLNLTNENMLPKHRLTFNKAFELVAIFGPLLYWDNPNRTVKPRKSLKIDPAFFGITPQQMQQYQQAQQPPPPPQPGQPPPPPPPQIDPQLQQAMGIWQWSQQTEQQRANADRIRCQLLENWLNYTPSEMPNGGLAGHSRMAIVEALVKGRGCLWTEPFQFPGSDKVITGNFYDTVDHLLIDPDATSLADAKWIARTVTAPTYEVEEEFGLPPGSLEGKGASAIGPSKASPVGTSGESRQDKVGRTSELITYRKIFSRCGVGTKLIGEHVDSELKQNLERVTGKFVFLCIADGVEYPLNLSIHDIDQLDDDEVREKLEWPFPTWKDDRWPVSVLDFYPHPNKPWPIAPLAPALGELTFLQLVMSHLCDRVVKSSRDFIACLSSAGEEIENALKNGGDLTVLKLTEVHTDIGRVVQFLQQPQVNKDAWEIVDRVTQLFERRTGLTELMGGQTSTQSRSAEDAKVKGAQINVRPDDMQRRVEEWQTDAARAEKIAVRWFIEAKDVQVLFGPVGAYLWQQYITSEDPELVIRETDCTIEAGSVRKPNKARDVENTNQLAQFIGPILAQHFTQSGDPGPLMWLITSMADTFDMDVSGLQLSPPQPDPNQQAQQQQQQQEHQQKMQLEMQKLQGQIQVQQMQAQAAQTKAQADMEKSQLDRQMAQIDAQVEQQRSQSKLAADAANIQVDRVKGEQEIQIQGAKAQQELQVAQLKAEMEMQQNQVRMAQAQQSQEQDPMGGLFDENPSSNGKK